MSKGAKITIIALLFIVVSLIKPGLGAGLGALAIIIASSKS